MLRRSEDFVLARTADAQLERDAKLRAAFAAKLGADTTSPPIRTRGSPGSWSEPAWPTRFAGPIRCGELGPDIADVAQPSQSASPMK